MHIAHAMHANMAVSPILAFVVMHLPNALDQTRSALARSTIRHSADRCLWRLVRLRFNYNTGRHKLI